LLLTSSSYFQSSAVPGWTFNEYQHSSKPCPLPAIFGRPFIIKQTSNERAFHRRHHKTLLSRKTL
jgi:hypothetical protein